MAKGLQITFKHRTCITISSQRILGICRRKYMCLCVCVYSSFNPCFSQKWGLAAEANSLPKNAADTGPGCASHLWCNPLLPLCDGTWEN